MEPKMQFRVDLNGYTLEQLIAMKSGDHTAAVIRYGLENAARDCDEMALGCAAQYAFGGPDTASLAYRQAVLFRGKAEQARAALVAFHG